MQNVLIFDFDGVLADTRDDILRFAEIACAELGHPCQATVGDLDALEHMSFDHLARRLGVPEDGVEAFTKRSFELFNARPHPPAVVAGMPAVVARLSQRHHIGIVTGNNPETVREFLQRHGLQPYVQAVLAVDAPGTRPEKIQRIAASIGDPDSEIYVIGDAVSDIRAARQASAKSVAATWGHQSGTKLEAAGPDFVVHAPEELLGLFGDTSGKNRRKRARTKGARQVKPFRDHITAWAETQPTIRAVLMVGSRAQREPPPDEWADLDLMLFATDFDAYLGGTDWLDVLGTVWVCIPHQTGDGDPERLVLFEEGHKVDFVFYPLDELRRMVGAQAMPDVYQRGYEILLDKDGLAAQLPPSPFAPPPLAKPSAEIFTRSVNTFWYGAVYVAKQIRRRNLWVVKFRDWTMKETLLQMLEWHARATHGWDYDTWHDGKFLLHWVDPRTAEALQDAFGHFDAADSWRALLATMDLFRRLATETAARLGLNYPTLLDERVTGLVAALHAGDDLIRTVASRSG